LVVGGYHCGATLASAEVFDPATNTWTPTGSMSQARDLFQAVLLQDGRVLVAGGHISLEPPYATFATAELYDPATGTWTATGSMSTARGQYGGHGRAAERQGPHRGRHRSFRSRR
jgi:hypothetical protein